MTAVQRVKDICKERKIAISKLESDCGFANGYISQLRKGTFPNDRLIKISEYLNVSMDYLINGKDIEFSSEMAILDAKITMSDKETKEYMLKFANLPTEKKKHIMDLIDMFM